ncbi:MAG: hypothetical protein HYT03_01505 [Candidatus Harrisonbacteria bacterium]|nr:hypothetical protein [Candidatus Harrisonbacteria bacterium]
MADANRMKSRKEVIQEVLLFLEKGATIIKDVFRHHGNMLTLKVRRMREIYSNALISIGDYDYPIAIGDCHRPYLCQDNWASDLRSDLESDKKIHQRMKKECEEYDATISELKQGNTTSAVSFIDKEVKALLANAHLWGGNHFPPSPGMIRDRKKFVKQAARTYIEWMQALGTKESLLVSLKAETRQTLKSLGSYVTYVHTFRNLLE